ncbi:MAG: 2-amino-4-hydroxy-6-hydroxymethyldihydropteridine diphosphokinase [Bacteroides sp.]|nr:2-amino-4-hydroxy-6-hydroxymethyldihydropteridine diphosphokinase [Bacteroides sp.]
MSKVYLSLGSNLGDKEKNLRDAVLKIEERIGKVISLSALYNTAPWGFESENSFLNAAIAIETSLTPHEILIATQQIEKELGRFRKSVNQQYTDRLIDIDLLIVDDLIYKENDLVLPHPFMTERLFVMEPLAEIAPCLIHPVSGKTMKEILATLH